MPDKYVYCINGNCDRQDRPFTVDKLVADKCPWCHRASVEPWTEALSQFTVYTDGSCPNNATGGAGGWAAVFVKGLHDPSNPPELVPDIIHHIATGYEPSTTNNRMEIAGVLTAVQGLCIPNYSKLLICSDSQYTINGFTSWVYNWPGKNWKAGKNPVKNRDLWEEALKALNTHNHDVSFAWVKGHAGHPFNELADSLAGKEARLIPN